MLVVWHGRSSGLLLLWQVCDQSLGRQDHRSNAGSILQGRARYLCRVDDTALDHILVLVGEHVVAVVLVLVLFLGAAHTFGDHRAVASAVDCKLAQWLLQGAAQDSHTRRGVSFEMQAIQRFDSIQQGHATAGYHTLFDACASSGKRILNTRLTVFQFNLGASADLNKRYAAGQLRQALLELLTIIVAGRLFDLRLDLADASLDFCRLTLAFDNGRIILVGDDEAGRSEVGKRRVVKPAAHLFADHLSTGQGSDVAQHLFAAVAEARSLDSQHIEDTAQLVDNQGSQRLTIDILGNDDDLAATLLRHLLQDGQDILHCADLLVGNENVGVLDGGFHFLRVGHEVGGGVALVDLHTFDIFGLKIDTPGFLNGDDAIFPDLVHHFSDEVPNSVVGSRDGGDLCDLLLAINGDRQVADKFHDSFGPLVDAMLELHRIGAGGQGLPAKSPLLRSRHHGSRWVRRTSCRAQRCVP